MITVKSIIKYMYIRSSTWLIQTTELDMLVASDIT